MQHSKPTQNDRILDYMDKHGGITQIEAILRRMGFPIESTTQQVKNRYGETCHVKRYSLGDYCG